MKSSLFRGRYLFHFHTTYTDGQLAVKDYFEFAVHSGADSLIFLEHVRKKPTYDVHALLAEVEELSEKSAIRTSVGFEARLVAGGELDIDDMWLERAEIIGIAEHSFPSEGDLLESSFCRVLDTYIRELPKKTFVWVHPGLWFLKHGMEPSENAIYWEMLRSAENCGVMIERNLRYRLVEDQVLPKISAESIVLGADAHTKRDLEIWKSVQ